MSRRIYRPRPFWIAFFSLGAMVFLYGAHRGVVLEDLALWQAAILVMFAVLALSLAASRVELDDAGIAFVWLRRHELPRANIAGWKMKGRPPIGLVLLPDIPTLKKVEIPSIMNLDAEFARWLSGIPNLDPKERKEEPASAIEQRRERAVRRARWLSRALTATTIAAVVWALFYPRPYVAALGVNGALPLLALLLLSRGQGLYSALGNDPRPSLASALFLPGSVIMVRAVLDLNLLSWRPLGVRSALMAVLLALWVMWSDQRLPRRAVVIVAVFLAAYTGGSLALINCSRTGSTPQLYRAQVLQKRPTTYRLILGPWASQPAGSSVKVSQQVFDAVHEGQQVSVLLYPGKLRVPWFRVASP